MTAVSTNPEIRAAIARNGYRLREEGEERSVPGRVIAAPPPGERFDVVAATLGADRWTTFRRVTLPLAMPGLLAGSVLAWARSLGEFGATITFAGNYPGTTQTMPSLIYSALQSDPAVARTLSMILLVLSIGTLAALRNRWLTTP